MLNFVILFEEKEGTSPVVRLLDNFEHISVVHQVEEGWEPFNLHNAGAMRDRDLARCFDHIFGSDAVDMDALNAIYTRTATRPLEDIDASGSVGFKMRWRSNERRGSRLLSWLRPRGAAPGIDERYESIVMERLRHHDVVVFMAVRQDVFRWALSKYHGDGTGKPGHLQFKLASGEITRDDIGRITVDTDRFEEIVADCERRHEAKRALLDRIGAAGIRTGVLRYEDFMADQHAYFRAFAEAIDAPTSDEAIETAINAGQRLEKVHSDDISEFVVNHEEVMARFGGRRVDW